MTDKIDMSAPERIWLQTGGSYADAYEATIGADTGVTWCDHCVDDDDAEYIRADIAQAERQRAEKAEARAERLREAALEVAAFRAQVTHGEFHRMSLIRALERLETALRQDEGGE